MGKIAPPTSAGSLGAERYSGGLFSALRESSNHTVRGLHALLEQSLAGTPNRIRIVPLRHVAPPSMPHLIQGARHIVKLVEYLRLFFVGVVHHSERHLSVRRLSPSHQSKT